MSAATVQGYVDDVSYAVDLDDASKDPLDGVLIGGNTAVISPLLRSHEGEQGSLSPTSGDTTVTITTVEGALAGLLTFTQVTSVEGDDLPAGATYGPDDMIGNADY